VRVFLFGSIARTWPQATVGADFDLGYEIACAQGDKDARRRELERDLESLTSIRPVDLVDFSKADEAFRTEATKHIVELAHEPSATAKD
jgi:predicted nucleotidyltransferase